MSETFYVACGVASGVLMASCGIPYIIDTLRHKTKPERATWWVWAGLALMAIIAQLQAGVKWAVLMSVGSFVSCCIIAVLSLRYGYGYFKLKDGLALVVAAAGVALSLILKSPLLALIIVIGVDAIGYYLTLVKAWEAPETETLITWVLATIAGLLGVLAISQPNFTKLLYPLYILVGNTILISVILHRRKKTTPKSG